ncbi:MAG: glutathione S-transferase family protein [Phormidesmis sp. RL_2_1]|nr:glutathione S-transferase family protein [Phormidesmis sp. RL_2_1]
MLELHQFEASHYSEKVRLVLDYKQLPYKTIEVSPGIGQIELYRLSGQRQVPVLKDGDVVIPDSTAIARYLDKKYPERPLIPTEPKQKGLCLMMEAWADESIGLNGRKAMIGAFNQHPNFRTALLPVSTPELVKSVIGAVPGDVLNLLGTGVGFGSDAVKSATEILRQDLEALCLILGTQPYLCGDQPTLADFAVAGLSMYLKFPSAVYVDLPMGICDKGVPGLADDPAFSTFWQWREQLYRDFRKQRSTRPSAGAPVTDGATGPVAIGID